MIENLQVGSTSHRLSATFPSTSRWCPTHLLVNEGGGHNDIPQTGAGIVVLTVGETTRSSLLLFAMIGGRGF